MLKNEASVLMLALKVFNTLLVIAKCCVGLIIQMQLHSQMQKMMYVLPSYGFF